MSEIRDEQIRYYRRRAAEYDETSSWREDPFEEDWRILAQVMDTLGPLGSVLEIACGTGQWTEQLLRESQDITALDSSPEMIDINKAKLHGAPIRYMEADVFSWEPDRLYDAVFFANWLSHVLPSDFARFWGIVGDALTPEGRVFFVDEAQDAWRHEEPTEVPYVVTRRLRDGSTHRAVKVFWDAGELRSRLRDLGWDAQVTATPALLYGHARPDAR